MDCKLSVYNFYGGIDILVCQLFLVTSTYIACPFGK